MQEYIVQVYNDRTEWKNKEGQWHRIDGPAVEYKNGDKYWYQNDKLHRTDGPAVEYAYGTKEWFQNDKLHRTDGPAIEYEDGLKSWYIKGLKLTQEEFNQRTKPKPCAGKIVEVDGVKYTLT